MHDGKGIKAQCPQFGLGWRKRCFSLRKKLWACSKVTCALRQCVTGNERSHSGYADLDILIHLALIEPDQKPELSRKSSIRHCPPRSIKAAVHALNALVERACGNATNASGPNLLTGHTTSATEQAPQPW